jgi:hypothetical protein
MNIFYIIHQIPSLIQMVEILADIRLTNVFVYMVPKV